MKIIEYTDTSNIGGEHKMSIDKAIIQRLFTDSVPDQGKLPRFLIKQCDCKHSLALSDRLLHAICLKRLEQYFGIRCSAKGCYLFFVKKPVP